MHNAPRTPADTDVDTDETLRAAADALHAQFTRGDITATDYRQRLMDLKAGTVTPDTTPPAPTSRYRGPVTRTATAPAPKKRETR